MYIKYTTSNNNVSNMVKNKFSYQVKIMASTPSALKNPESMNMQIFLIRFSFSSFTAGSILSVCALEVSSFHIIFVHIAYWPMIDSKLVVMSQIMLICAHLKVRFKMSTEKLSHLSR